MRLAIAHYHLRKGGVTRVIASALEALGPAVEAVVLSSTEPEEPLPCPVRVIPGLGYDREASMDKASALSGRMRASAREALGGDPEIWHLHNHCLGKNVNLPEVVRRLARDGERLLLQIHDFAEDGRPTNYAEQQHPYREKVFQDPDAALYPVAPQIGYAVLNGRDQKVLLGAGIPEDRVHWLPNAVTTPSLQAEEPRGTEPGKPPLLLYPTRAIRRKNIGELLLLAAVCPEFRYGTTLSPKNPQWHAVYRHWVRLAEDLRLPVAFGLGEQPDTTFSGLIQEAHAMITTSVGEGFGLAFLEPWLMGRPVAGRDLPAVTADFKANGIELPDLYASWPIALDTFDAEALRQRYIRTAMDTWKAFGREPSRKQLEGAWNHLTGGGNLDFGCMDETAQTEVLRNIRSQSRDLLHPLNLSDIGARSCRRNARLIEESYGLAPYAAKLKAIYAELLGVSIAEPAAAEASAILEAFLDPMRLNLLRT